MVKGKRWKKGESSSSNPATKKYRDASKSSFFNINNNSKLTVDALSKLDSMTVNNENVKNDDDNKSVCSSIDTFKSWASNWSDCTNATFNRVHRYWKSNSALHKEILAVLAAITEVIKTNNGKENDTEYFAALMAGIESIQNDDNPTSITAFLYLCALAIRKVPINVLKVKYEELTNTYLKILDKYDNSNNSTNTTLVKSCLLCICWLLKEQDKQTWQNKYTTNVFNRLLSYINHPKAKVRKCSYEAICLILNKCSITNIQTLITNYCLKQIEEFGNEQNHIQVLYTLQFLKQTIHEIHSTNLKSICECLLRLMSLNNILITSSCFQVYHQLFLCESKYLSADINAQLINALYDYQPNENDPQQLIAWLVVMQYAFINLNRLSNEICVLHLPRIFNVSMCLLGSTHAIILEQSTVIVKCLLDKCVKQNIELLINDFKQNSDIDKTILKKVFVSIQSGLNYQYHNGWKYVMQILASTYQSFNDKNAFPIVKESLYSLANLRESEQFSYKSEADYALSKAIKTYGPQLILDAIKLNINGDEENFNYPRSWLLPLLIDNIENTELSFFIKYFMPLANKLKERSLTFQELNKQIEFKIFDTLYKQMWSLFPGFCIRPTDLNTSFKQIAQYLGELLDKSIDLRACVLNGLKNLLNKNIDENKPVMNKYAKNYIPILLNIYVMDKRLDKDPLRQLLLETIRSYIRICDSNLANTFLQRTIIKFNDNNQQQQQQQQQAENNNNNNNNQDPFTKYSLLDLICVIVPFSNQENLKTVYDLALFGIINNSDKTLQKRSYKILDTILTNGKPTKTNDNKENRETISKFINDNFNNISNAFISTLSSCNSAAKPPRLKCVLHLMDYVNDKDFIRKVLPEIILCIKEVNHKSREASCELINSMAKLWQKLSTIANGQSEPDALYDYIHLLMIGFAGSKTMIQCSCLALQSLIAEFKEHITGNLIKELIDAACLLITKSNDKEVISCSLNLIKTYAIIFNDATLAQYLNDLLNTIVFLYDKQHIQFKSQRIRTQIKIILKKLIKKFSYQIIYEKLMSIIEPNKQNLKDEFHKQLNYLRKLIDREKKLKKLKEENQNNNDNSVDDGQTDLISVYTTTKTAQTNINEIEDLLDDSEDEDEDDKKSRRSQKTNKTNDGKKDNNRKERMIAANGLTWIKENENDDPLNLLDPMAIKNVLATRPPTNEELEKRRLKEANNKNRGFKVNNQGKLIINDEDDGDGKNDQDSSDDDDDDDDTNNKFTKKNKKPEGLDELMDTLSISLSKKSASKSKKNADDSDDEDERDNFTYKSGGTGIHRTIGGGISKTKKNNPNKRKTITGGEYRARKAGGDMKLKNKPDPYAYVPLDFNKLNKRKKAKLHGEFKGFIKAAQRGAKVGSKLNRLKSKKSK